MNCLLCLNINESGKKSFNSDEWKELNIQYIVEKYLWKMENLNNHSYICQTCWQELSNFHNFYLKIEKANSNLNILVKSEVVSEDVLKDKGILAEQICIDSNENSEIPPKILFVKEESPLEIFDVEEESCLEAMNKRKRPLRKIKNNNKNITKNNPNKICRKEKDITVINELEYEGDLTEQICVDSNENSQIQTKVLLVNNESPLETFEKEDAEEVSSLKNNIKPKRVLRKNTNDIKNFAKPHPKKILRKVEDTSVISKSEDKGDLAEQIFIVDKETSQIGSEILFLKEVNPLEMFEKEDVGEVSSLKNSTERKRPLRKSTNDKKNIAKNNTKKRLKKEKVTKPEDNKNRDEEIDIKLKEVENDTEENKIDEHLNDQKDSFVSDVDPSTNSVDSSKVEQEQDKFIAEHFQITCSLCDIPLATFDIMVKHNKEQHNQRGYATCCDQKLSSRLEIVDHIKLHQNPEYFNCKICDKILISRACLKKHIKYAHKEKNVECDICGKFLASEAGLKTHKLIHEPDNKNKIHCELCDKSYVSRDSLNTHMRFVHLKQHKICDLCGKSEKNNYRLKIHMLLRHSEKGRPTVSCEVCGRVLSDIGCLKRHMSSNHPPNGINPEFNCPVCNKIFTSNANLKTHVWRVHENKYERKCTLCGKIFKSSGSLKDHMSTHTGNPLRTCTFCPRTFNSNGNMYAHRKRAHPIEWEKSVREKMGGKLPDKSITKTIEN